MSWLEHTELGGAMNIQNSTMCVRLQGDAVSSYISIKMPATKRVPIREGMTRLNIRSLKYVCILYNMQMTLG